ncbi:MAG: TraB/GumN family protein [Thermoanaerobaculia bacterium]|nr:TraB/GumN family protein [Thermoanaerobaculia bacterium]
MWIFRSESSYLVGSIHVLPGNWAGAVAGVLKKQLSGVSRLIVEADLRDLKPPSNCVFEDGVCLESVVPPDLWEEALVLASNQGLGDQLSSLKPWWAALTLTAPIVASLNLSGKFGVDSIAMRCAAEAGIEIRPLESTERGFRCWDDSPLSEQLWHLESVVRRPQEARSKIKRLVTSFSTGTPDVLIEALQNCFRDQPLTFGCLIGARNAEWLPALDSELRAGNALIVVGGLHLVSPMGLLAQLKTLGHNFQRV